MKTIKLGMEEAFQVSQIITKLLTFNGIERKKAYWLAKNREHLKPFVEEGVKKASEVEKRFSIEIPNEAFVPVVKYHAFKKEMMTVLNFLQFTGWTGFERDSLMSFIKSKWEMVNSTFEKYEMRPAVSMGVPIEKKEEYQKALKEELEAMGEREYEYAEIISNQVFDKVLQNLTGKEINVIAFMLKEPSAISIAGVENEVYHLRRT